MGKRWRHRLRFRLLVAFAGGGLLLSVALSSLTYTLARNYLLEQRQSSGVIRAQVNARFVASALRSPQADVPQVLDSLQQPAGSSGVVLHDGRWFTASLAFGRDALPGDLQGRVVQERSRARQRVVVDGQPLLVVGLPLPEGDAYFEVFPLRELDRTLRTLRLSLGTAAVATIVGAAGLGVWASRRLLDPLARIGAIATSIADGALEARLDVGDDEELAALASSFNRMVGTLQERIERDARFASNVSHELRSPLTTLKSAVQAMQTRRNEISERSGRSLDLLAREVGRFERLVQDLLEISRFDAGAVHGSFEEVYLGELVLHAVEAVGDDGIPVEVAADATKLLVRADKRRLERVIANLVDNANVHGGGVSGVRVQARGHHGRISIEDRGPGVPAENRTRIFERFFRGDAGRGSGGGGAGLGLALVMEHTRLHGGRVWVEEADDGGARFVVELPAEQI